MAEPFLGEIKMVGFNFAPQGWAFCAGQLLAINQNTALFSLLGTQFGGDGQSTFALPNLQSRIPVGFGQGPGLSPYQMGQVSGSESVAVQVANLPAHSHLVAAVAAKGNSPSPASHLPATDAAGVTAEYSTAAPTTTMNERMITPTGGNVPLPILPPTLGVNFIIALAGIFPARA